MANYHLLVTPLSRTGSLAMKSLRRLARTAGTRQAAGQPLGFSCMVMDHDGSLLYRAYLTFRKSCDTGGEET